MAGTKTTTEGQQSLVCESVFIVDTSVLNSLEGVDISSIQDRTLCYVRTPSVQYRFFEDSLAVPSDPAVILPVGVQVSEPGRWLIIMNGAGGAVDSVFGRIGDVAAQVGDYSASLVINDSGVSGANVDDALDTLASAIPPAAPVDSVHGRTGAVVSVSGDYDSNEITNQSSVTGASVTAALNNLLAAIGPGPTTALIGHTGLITGGVVSINGGDNTLFDLTAGSGWVISHADPENPTAVLIEWLDQTALPVTGLATSSSTGISYNGIGSGSLVEQLNGIYTPLERRQLIPLGLLIHPNNLNLDGVSTTPGAVAYNGQLSFEDFIREVIGPANSSGNVFSDNGSNLELSKSAGVAYGLSANVRLSSEVPNLTQDPQLLGPLFRKLYRSATPNVLAQDGPAVTVIDPTQWDNGSGTLQPVTPNDWTVLVLYWSPSAGVAVGYGQSIFNTQLAAETAVRSGTLAYQEFPQLAGALLRAFLVVREDSTDLSNPVQATFIEASSFRGGGTQLGSTVGLTFPTFVFSAQDFDDPNNADWAVNGLALIDADSNNPGLSNRRFDDTTEQGVGFDIPVPTAATCLTIVIVHRAEIAPGGAVTVQPAIYNRSLAVDAAVTAWSAAFNADPLDIPTNENWQYDLQTVELSTLEVVAGSVNQFELTRKGLDVDDSLSGDWDIYQVLVRFS